MKERRGRATVDGQRLGIRLRLLAAVGRRALERTGDPPTALQLKLFEGMLRVASRGAPDGVRWRDLTVSGGEGPRRARLYEPGGLGEGAGLIVFVHGGGWQVGSIAAYDGTCAFLAATARMKVLSLDYRLSWEARFPAAFDDVVAAFIDVVERAEELGVARDRIAIAGDSAGGNIAAAAALHLGADRDHRPKPAALIYPFVDADLDRYESTRLFHAPLTRKIVHRDLRRYAPAEEDHRDPRFAPMASTDLSPMPPTYVATAGMDVLRDQGEAFAARLREAGASADLRRFANLPHGFFGILVDPLARAATEEIATAVGGRV